eukprot:scaffold69464_cov45-Phaeocystis_antarctica.AAC.1
MVYVAWWGSGLVGVSAYEGRAPPAQSAPSFAEAQVCLHVDCVIPDPNSAAATTQAPSSQADIRDFARTTRGRRGCSARRAL